MTDIQKLRIAIVGGGIAGLALAGGLAKQEHLDIHVYESVPAYKDVGAGLGLPLNAVKAMGLISPALQKAFTDRTSMQSDTDEEVATEVILAQGPRAGELVAELGKARNRKTISRADLLDAFMQFVPQECITFGMKLQSINERDTDIELTFTDMSTATADCVLAADGIHSVTRSYLLGADHPAAAPKNHEGWQIYRTMISTEEAKKHINEKWTRRVPILMGPRGHINCIPLNKCTRLSAGVAVRGAKFTEGGAPPLDPALYSDYSEDARRIVELVARDTSASWTAADHDHAPYYARRCIAILGDSAHASLPFAGNGGAQALEDAAVLNYLFSNVKKREHIEPALQAYDTVRRPRSQKVVDLARQFGRIYAYAEDGMQDDPARMKKFFAGAGSFMNNADLEKQNEDTMNLYLKSIAKADGKDIA